MGYLKVIEASTTWTCPKTGSYKIICVAGGQGGTNTQGTSKNGGSTKFGDYLSASGQWGEAYSLDSQNTVYSGGLNGYTFLSYGEQINLKADYGIRVQHSIGYGGGGSGKYAGGIGKLKTGIVNLNEGDTISCTIGAGGDPESDTTCTGGKPGVIVIQYLGDDGWFTSGNETEQTITISLYMYGSLYKTEKISAGSTYTLPKLDNVKSDDVEHVGWTKTAGSGTRDYAAQGTINPISNIELHAVYKYKVKDKKITRNISNSNSPYTLVTSGSGYIVGNDGYLSGSGEHTTHTATDLTLSTNGSGYYVKVNNSYISGIVGPSNSSISWTFNKGDIVTVSASPQYGNLYAVIPDLDYNYYYRSSVT